MTSEDIWNKASKMDVEAVMTEFLEFKGAFKKNRAVSIKQLIPSALFLTQMANNATSIAALSYEIEKYARRNFLYNSSGDIVIPDSIYIPVYEKQKNWLKGIDDL